MEAVGAEVAVEMIAAEAATEAIAAGAIAATEVASTAAIGLAGEAVMDAAVFGGEAFNTSVAERVLEMQAAAPVDAPLNTPGSPVDAAVPDTTTKTLADNIANAKPTFEGNLIDESKVLPSYDATPGSHIPKALSGAPAAPSGAKGWFERFLDSKWAGPAAIVGGQALAGAAAPVLKGEADARLAKLQTDEQMRKSREGALANPAVPAPSGQQVLYTASGKPVYVGGGLVGRQIGRV